MIMAGQRTTTLIDSCAQVLSISSQFYEYLRLKDCLFHGVGKYIRDSIRYLFSTPGTSYLQLMVATHKAESKNEEIQDKVRARVAEATESGEGTTELGQNIAKLMVALTKIGHGNRPASTPSSPRERGCSRGHADRGTPRSNLWEGCWN